MFRTYQVLFNRLLVALDGLIVITSFLGAWYIKFHSGWLAHGGHLPLRAYGPAILAGVPVFLAANWLSGLYRPMRAKSIWAEAYAILKSAIIGLLVFMSILYFVKMADFSRDVLTLFTLCFVSLTLAERLTLRAGLRAMRARGFNQKFILIVGWNQAAERFVRTLEQQPWFGYRILGYLSDPAGDRADKPGIPCIGTRGQLGDVLAQHLVDQVVIALPRGEFSAIGQVIQHCEAQGVQSLILPDYFDLLPARPRFETFGDIPLIDTRYVPLDDAMNAALKRAFDIVFSLLVLIGLSPLFLAVAIGVKLSSPGPVLYVQPRVGKNRRVFKMYKFRTMYWDGRSGTATAQSACASPSGAGGTEERVGDTGDETAGATFIGVTDADTGWTVPNDPRRTRFGAFLRRTSLDELPQFWNVLIGDMSVIGPRPERPYFVEQFKDEIPRYMVKHRVRPGITGWAQVHGWRGDTSIAERIQYDLEYIENWSLGLDMRIILRTLRDGIVNENAY